MSASGVFIGREEVDEKYLERFPLAAQEQIRAQIEEEDMRTLHGRRGLTQHPKVSPERVRERLGIIQASHQQLPLITDPRTYESAQGRNWLRWFFTFSIVGLGVIVVLLGILLRGTARILAFTADLLVRCGAWLHASAKRIEG